MLIRLAHALAARPAVYDAIQRAAGVETVLREVREAVSPLPAPAIAADVGGGTGMLREIWPEATRYLNIEPDPAKLIGFRRRYPSEWALCGDGTRLPLRAGAVDAVTVQFVLHHLDDGAMTALLQESGRCLKPGGRLIVVEPLWEPGRIASRLLWRYDRGRFPRSEETLRAAMERGYAIESWRTFAVFHAYVIAVARRSA